MRELADIERRIERLCASESSGPIDAWLLAEMGDVLALGYAFAHRADAHSRGLAERIDRLLEGPQHPHAGDETWRLAKERRSVEDAARRLRARLDVVRRLFTSASPRTH
jgi:hypothetical protein